MTRWQTGVIQAAEAYRIAERDHRICPCSMHLQIMKKRIVDLKCAAESADELTP